MNSLQSPVHVPPSKRCLYSFQLANLLFGTALSGEIPHSTDSLLFASALKFETYMLREEKRRESRGKSNWFSTVNKAIAIEFRVVTQAERRTICFSWHSWEYSDLAERRYALIKKAKSVGYENRALISRVCLRTLTHIDCLYLVYIEGKLSQQMDG